MDHRSVIDFNNRPFEDVLEMREALLGQINDLPKNATLYILGDMVVSSNRGALEALLNRIRRDIKLVFVLGNHDDQLQNIFARFGEVHYLLHLRLDKKLMVLCHYPMAEWRSGSMGSVHFHGHCHGRYSPSGKTLDVGWDVHKRLLPLEEAYALADAKPIYQPCHDRNNG